MYNIAIIGALSRVGTELLEILEEIQFPVGDIFALGTGEDRGARVNFKEDSPSLAIKDVNGFDFSNVDFVFNCAGNDMAQNFAQKIAQAGSVLIDGSSYFSDDPQVPLVIPQVNPQHIADYTNKSVISSPNANVIQMLIVLAPLHIQFGIKRIICSTYQSVSQQGNEALSELFEQTLGIYSQKPIVDTKNVFTKQIAFNVIPHVGQFMEDGYTQEEYELAFETKRILDQSIELTATCVTIPVFIGNAMALNVEFNDNITEASCREILSKVDDVSLIDYRAEHGYVTPVEAAGLDKVYVSRLRMDQSCENAINLWVVGDNLRKGSALNMAQIALELTKFR